MRGNCREQCVLIGKAYDECAKSEDRSDECQVHWQVAEEGGVAALVLYEFTVVGQHIDHIVLLKLKIGRPKNHGIVQVHPMRFYLAVGLGTNEQHIGAHALVAKPACFANHIHNRCFFVADIHPAILAYFTHQHHPKIEKMDIDHRVFYIGVQPAHQGIAQHLFVEAGGFHFTNHRQADIAIIIYKVSHGACTAAAGASTAGQQVENSSLRLVE